MIIPRDVRTLTQALHVHIWSMDAPEAHRAGPAARFLSVSVRILFPTVNPWDPVVLYFLSPLSRCLQGLNPSIRPGKSI